jgi:hypothetical protein
VQSSVGVKAATRRESHRQLLGRVDKSIEALERDVDEGERASWWIIETHPAMTPLR